MAAAVTLVLPEWYEEKFVDVEGLFIDLFTALLPAVDVGCWYADDWLDDPSPDPQLQFFRLPGARVDLGRNSDVCHVQALAVSDLRDDSWRLINFVRSIVLPMQGAKVRMSDGFTASVWCSDDVSGPQMLTPAQQIDNRVIPWVFSVRVGLRSRKRYDDVLAGLVSAS